MNVFIELKIEDLIKEFVAKNNVREDLVILVSNQKVKVTPRSVKRSELDWLDR